MYTGIRCQLKITNLKDQLYLDRIIYTDALVTFNDINKCQNDVILVFFLNRYTCTLTKCIRNLDVLIWGDY